jgi:hypothetical protein
VAKQFIAFRPRQGLDTVIHFDDGMELSVDDVFFDYEIMEDEKIGIVLYIKDFNIHGEDITGPMYLLLDSVLGECDVETKIGYIVRIDLNEKNDQSRPLKELPTIVDNHFLID